MNLFVVWRKIISVLIMDMCTSLLSYIIHHIIKFFKVVLYLLSSVYRIIDFFSRTLNANLLGGVEEKRLLYTTIN